MLGDGERAFYAVMDVDTLKLRLIETGEFLETLDELSDPFAGRCRCEWTESARFMLSVMASPVGSRLVDN